MRIADYYHDILVPANVAVSAVRLAGLPIDLTRLRVQRAAWLKEITERERRVEGAAAERGVILTYSTSHAPQPMAALGEFLFDKLGLVPGRQTPKGRRSADSRSLIEYASVDNPRPGDHPIVFDILKIRSLSKGINTFLANFESYRRSDGAVHPKYNWHLRTPRLSAEAPPVHQIPEHADLEVAAGVKSCMVPRMAPAPSVDEWDPRKHGSCLRWDVAGAEAAVRIAMLTTRFCSTPDPMAQYIREGKDIHARTASLIYDVPEGTYTKGTMERDVVAKMATFLKLYGGGWKAFYDGARDKARLLTLTVEKARDISTRWEAGLPGVMELYERDCQRLGELGYCEDGYGRRRWVGLPDGVVYEGVRDGKASFEVRWAKNEDERKLKYAQLNNKLHIMANTPTQGMSATDVLWAISLMFHGEYVDLQVPPYWADSGVLFPEAAGWQLHEGAGPGGRPFQGWHSNSVHDSGWLDVGPNFLEPTMMVIVRRCTAVPHDWRLEADVPLRIDLKVGPDHAHLIDYNVVARKFGLAEMPIR